MIPLTARLAHDKEFAEKLYFFSFAADPGGKGSVPVVFSWPFTISYAF
jgi:hypothetical protein